MRIAKSTFCAKKRSARPVEPRGGSYPRPKHRPDAHGTRRRILVLSDVVPLSKAFARHICDEISCLRTFSLKLAIYCVLKKRTLMVWFPLSQALVLQVGLRRYAKIKNAAKLSSVRTACNLPHRMRSSRADWGFSFKEGSSSFLLVGNIAIRV